MLRNPRTQSALLAAALLAGCRAAPVRSGDAVIIPAGVVAGEHERRYAFGRVLVIEQDGWPDSDDNTVVLTLSASKRDEYAGLLLAADHKPGTGFTEPHTVALSFTRPVVETLDEYLEGLAQAQKRQNLGGPDLGKLGREIEKKASDDLAKKGLMLERELKTHDAVVLRSLSVKPAAPR
jgi:hypothetical protein